MIAQRNGWSTAAAVAEPRQFRRTVLDRADAAWAQRGQPVADDRRPLLAGQRSPPSSPACCSPLHSRDRSPRLRCLRNPRRAGELRGMGAVAAGLILAMAVKDARHLCATTCSAWLYCRSALATALAAIAVFPPAGVDRDRPRPCSAGAPARAGRWQCSTRAAWGGRRDEHAAGGRPARVSSCALPVPSLLSIGGAMSTAPEMHRYFVDRARLGSRPTSPPIALAQAAPDPTCCSCPVLGFRRPPRRGERRWWASCPRRCSQLGIEAAEGLETGARYATGARAFTARLAPVAGPGVRRRLAALALLPFVWRPGASRRRPGR